MNTINEPTLWWLIFLKRAKCVILSHSKLVAFFLMIFPLNDAKHQRQPIVILCACWAIDSNYETRNTLYKDNAHIAPIRADEILLRTGMLFWNSLHGQTSNVYVCLCVTSINFPSIWSERLFYVTFQFQMYDHQRPSIFPFRWLQHINQVEISAYRNRSSQLRSSHVSFKNCRCWVTWNSSRMRSQCCAVDWATTKPYVPEHDRLFFVFVFLFTFTFRSFHSALNLQLTLNSCDWWW